MSGQRKQYIPVLIMCFAIVTCLIMTILIVMKMIPAKADTKKEVKTLKNVYITETAGGNIRFLSKGKWLEYSGKIEEEYRGVADIRMKNNTITKIYIKPDYVDGLLLAYDDNQMKIDGVGIVERNKNIPIYVDDGTSVGQTEASELIVGSSRLRFVFENGQVCALVMEPTTKVSDIRVLLKNGEQIYHEGLYIKGDKKWYINGEEQQKKAVCDIGSFLSQRELLDCDIDGGDGKLYLCNANGKKIKEGYEGDFSVQKTDQGLVIINILPVEDYVRYVLPSEMMATFSYEALKAQAICARTFAYSQMKGDDYAQFGANLDDSTSYQVYHASGTFDATDRAVAETKGQVLTYEDKMITCYYFSTSAGMTENLEVWGNSKSPAYLKARSCLQNEECGDLSEDKAFYQFIHSAPQSYDSGSGFYRWTAKLDLSAITDSEKGALKNIKIAKRSKSGYITSLTCVYENGSKRLTNENEIRTFLGKALLSLTLADGSQREFSTVPSACFEVSERNGSKVTLTGGGFGHGIGMSQYGANAMGEAGADCAQILAFYYDGTEIKQY